MAVCPRTRLANDEKVEVRLKLSSLRRAQRLSSLSFLVFARNVATKQSLFSVFARSNATKQSLFSVFARNNTTKQSLLSRLCEEQCDVAISLFSSLRGATRRSNLVFKERETATTLCQSDLPHPLKPNGKGSRSDGLKCPCEECCDKAIRLFSSLREATRRGNLVFKERETATTLCQSNLPHPLKLNGKGSRSDGLKCLYEEHSHEAISLLSSLRGATRRSNLQYHK